MRLEAFSEALIDAAFRTLRVKRPLTFLVEAQQIAPARGRRREAVWVVRMVWKC